MSENPYEPTSVAGTDETNPDGKRISSERAAYNVVSDMVIGVNVRKQDNKFQALFILAAVAIFAALGAILAFFFKSWELPWYGGAIAGSFAGLVLGFFASGIVLMIYRGMRHVKGKHD